MLQRRSRPCEPSSQVSSAELRTKNEKFNSEFDEARNHTSPDLIKNMIEKILRTYTPQSEGGKAKSKNKKFKSKLQEANIPDCIRASIDSKYKLKLRASTLQLTAEILVLRFRM